MTLGQGEKVKKFHIRDLTTGSESAFTLPHGAVVVMYRDLAGATNNLKHHQMVTDAGGCHSIGVEFNSGLLTR